MGYSVEFLVGHGFAKVKRLGSRGCPPAVGVGGSVASGVFGFAMARGRLWYGFDGV